MPLHPHAWMLDVYDVETKSLVEGLRWIVDEDAEAHGDFTFVRAVHDLTHEPRADAATLSSGSQRHLLDDLQGQLIELLVRGPALFALMCHLMRDRPRQVMGDGGPAAGSRG